MARRFGYYHRRDFYMTDSLKARINAAFECFRKLGFVARQNFSCCGGCAGYEIASYIGEKVKKDERNRSKIKGCVFYHRQDTETMYETGDVYLRFGQVDCADVGPVGLETEVVGKLVTEVLSSLEIPFEWNGDGHSCIVAKLGLIGKPMALAVVN